MSGEQVGCPKCPGLVSCSDCNITRTKAVRPPPKDCCVGDKIRVSIESFDRGCLTTYRSLKYAVQHLSRDEAVELISELITELEAKESA